MADPTIQLVKKGANTATFFVSHTTGASGGETIVITHGLGRKPDFVLCVPTAKTGTSDIPILHAKYFGTIGTNADLDGDTTVIRLYAPQASTTYECFVMVGIRHSIVK